MKVKTTANLFIGLVVLGLTLWAGGAFASDPPQSDTITVTATNTVPPSIFTFDIAATAFDFCQVNANGSQGGPPPCPTGESIGPNAVYEVLGATNWTLTSTPTREVRIYNSSSVSTINWGTADRLSIKTGHPIATLCGYKTFLTNLDGFNTCDFGALLRQLNVDAGGQAGTLDLKLDVLVGDAAGTNTWTVQLTATGS